MTFFLEYNHIKIKQVYVLKKGKKYLQMWKENNKKNLVSLWIKLIFLTLLSHTVLF